MTFSQMIPFLLPEIRIKISLYSKIIDLVFLFRSMLILSFRVRCAYVYALSFEIFIAIIEKFQIFF